MTDAKRSLYHELLALSERETIRQLDTALGRFVEEASTKGGAGGLCTGQYPTRDMGASFGAACECAAWPR